MSAEPRRVTELSADRLHSLVARIKQKDRARQDVTIRPRPAGTSHLPPSFTQERFWFLDQLGDGRAAYHVPEAVRLKGHLDIEALRLSLEEIVSRHEALRTTFVQDEKGLFQVVSPASGPALPLADLAALPVAFREEELLRLTREEALRLFDLERGPLVRVTLLRLAEGEHVLLVTMHHIVADGWSMGVLVREIGALYGALSAGRSSPLPELPVQYADYALWQRERFRGEALAAEVDWWREQLAGLPESLDLPADRPRPAVSTSRGGCVSLILGSEPSEALAAFAKERGATLFMVLLTGLQALLARYTGQTDLAVGSPIANRNRPEIAGLIGCFLNTLVLRADASGDPELGDLLERVRQTTLAAYEHQELPFEKVVEAVQPGRTLGRSPLFQVLAVLQSAPMRPLSLTGLEIARLPLHSGIAKFDLTVAWAEEGTRISGSIEHSSDLFDSATAERMAGHLTALLTGAASRAGTRLSELPLLTPAEGRQLLSEWSTSSPVPVLEGMGQGLYRLFEIQAERTPDAEALVAGTERLTYRELAARASRLARRLRDLGVGLESPVAVLLERSVDLVAALLAVLKAGGAYVPLDPAYPQERIAFALEDTGARVVLTRAALAGPLAALPAPPQHVLSLVPGDFAAEAALEPSTTVDPECLAYVIYTSGSTGRPKGVAIRHGSAAARVAWAARAFGPEDLAGVLASTSICFDLSVFELFVPLSLGGRVILAANALELPDLPAAGEVALLNTVPSAMAELVRAGQIPPSVRTVNLAGEPLPRALAEAIHGLGTVHGLLNLYGPSEDTTYSTVARIELGGERAPAIGRPLPGTRAYVVDRSLRMQPTGVPGELLLGGVGLARGYLNRPHITAERFVPDPFSAAAGERLYRTGDRACWRPGGELEYLGRLDHQVKIRGFRIELGEIEAVLMRHQAVREAVVAAREDVPGEVRLTAYVVLQPGLELISGELRDFLRQDLPDFMVPAAIVQLDLLPRLQNGKLDRRALPVPAGPAASGGQVYAAPRTPGEELLAAIWADLLHREHIGIHEDFFMAGGHSLLATRLISRIRDLFHVDLKLRAVFEAPTVALLAERIVTEQRAGGRLAVPPLRPVPRGRGLPLSFAQQRLWFLSQLEPGDPAYNMPLAVRLRGDLDIPALAATLREIVRRHETLRTTFPSADGRPVQQIAQGEGLTLPQIDVSALPAGACEGEALHLATEDARRPFDLERGPLFRPFLVMLAPAEHLVLATQHHIVSDGWSLDIFLNEVTELYGAFRDRRAPSLPGLPVQYADYAVWQREWLQGELLEAEISHWRRRLADAPPTLDLPVDRPRPATWSGRGARESLDLPADLSLALQALARRRRVTPFMLLLAAFGALLARVSGQLDLCVGAPVAGRRGLETERLIGLFVSTLVLRFELDGDPTLSEVVAQAREVALEAFAYQDLPFDKLVEELRPARALTHAPLFQTFFTVQNPRQQVFRLPGLEISGVAAESGATKFDLSLTLSDTGGERGYMASLGYATDLFDATTVRRLLAGYQALLESLLVDGELHLSSSALLPETERHQVAVEWNDSETEQLARTLHEMVQLQAERTPDRIALVGEEGSLSYGELNRWANRLAHRLRRAGARPGTQVALLVRRSSQMVAAILAVLKSGAAYIALDPEQPRVRQEQILAEAAPVLLLLTSEPADRLPAFGGEAHFLDARRESGEPEEAPAPLATPNDPAYLVFTSGSTGRPKGILTPHKCAAGYLEWALRRHGITAADTALQLAAPTFDASVRDTLGPLAVGARVVLVSRETAGDPAALVERMDRHGVTCLPSVVPSMLRRLAQEAVLAASPAPLRLILTSGESLHGVDCTRTREAFPGVRIVNQYGPSECTMTSTWHAASAPDERRGAVRIGRPRAQARVRLLGRSPEPVPLGARGEICIGGPGLAFGYLHQPDRTAEVFVPDPLAKEAGARLYRTGDLGRYLPDGSLEFLGRRDNQVKVRGIRIEPGEIESALAAHPAVAAAVVVARTAAAEDPLLIACLVAREGAAPTPASLRAFLRERLPEPMVPATFVTVESLPLTPHGKVDRRRLLELAEAVEPAEETAPRNEIEELLVGLWAQVLDRSRVGVHDDFFDLGGHSLLAMRLISKVREAFGLEMPLRTLFEAPSPAAMAERIAAASADQIGLHLPAITATGEPEAPLSFAQQRLWFLAQLEPGSPVYNLAYHVRFRGTLHHRALELALGEVVRRHAVLRTTFPAVSGMPVQRIAPGSAAVALPQIDLTTLPAEAGEKEAGRLSAEASRRPFDLTWGPMLRGALVRLAPQLHHFLLDLHHIVCDAWSRDLLAGELTLIYESFAAGRPSPLAELSVQYADFARWQRDVLQGEALDRQLAYWRDRLRGPLPQLELPTDRPRTSRQGSAGAFCREVLSSELANLVEQVARQRQVTPFMLLLAAFQALLYRYSGQSCVIVGTPIANRARPELEALIGFFVNALAMRADLTGELSFADLLVQVRRSALDAYSHQDLPFERLVEALQMDRGTGRTPLFQTMFVLENGAPLRRLEGLQLGRIDAHSGTAKFDLTLALARAGDHLGTAVEYSTELFDAATAQRFLGHYERLLQAMASTPQQAIAHLPYLSPAELDELLAGDRISLDAAAQDLGIHQMFEARVAERPEAVALTCGPEALTYGELDLLAGQLARCLRDLGVGPESRVGLCLERSLHLVVAILAVLKAGGAYVPINPADPAERLAYLLDDSAAQVILTESSLVGNLPEDRPLVICLDHPWPAVRSELPQLAVSGEQAAYVIYTSGSTGKPKGVVVTHANVLRLFRAAERWFDFGEQDVWTLFHSYAFDFSVWEIWGALAHGGRLVVVPYWTSRSPEDFLRLLAGEGVTVLNQTPSAFQILAHAEERVPCALSLRWIVFGGEALDFESLRPWLRRHGDEAPRLINMYGITETTVHVTYHQVALDAIGRRSLIGVPLPNLRIYLLDSSLELVPCGVPGEICVAGSGLARGYLDRPGLTAERFIPDPFSERPGTRIYRSGDLARRLPGGGFEHLGRADHQVKIRGFRIELGEIENGLLEHELVRAAVVLVREMKGGDRELVAFLACAEGDAPSREQLKARLAQTLPPHMIPDEYVILAELPLTGNGKVDRRKLAEMVLPQREIHGEAPAGPAEERLLALFEEVLGKADLPVSESFFNLGGDSIRAVRLAARITEEIAPSISVRDIFQFQTVRELAARIGEEAAEPAVESERLLGMQLIEQRQRAILADEEQRRKLPEDWEDLYPLSDIERGMVYYSLLLPGEPIYHDQFLHPLSLDDPERFFKAFDLLIKKHPALRSSFHFFSFGEPIKVVHRAVRPTWEVEDLSSLAPAARLERIRQYQARDLADKFRFDGDLMWRLKIFRLEDSACCLIWTFHHAILDGWSNATLRLEIEELCRRPDLDSIEELPQLRYNYKDYCAITLARRWSPRTEAFWRRVLAGHQRNKLPFHRSRRRGSFLGGSQILRRALSPDLLAALRRTASEERVALQTLCLSAHIYLLHVLAAEREVLTGIVSHDRLGIEDGDKILGCFLTTLPIRIGVTGRPTFRHLVREVHERVTAVKIHQIPLTEVAVLSGVRAGQENPFFDTLFNFMDFHQLEALGQRAASGQGGVGAEQALEASEMTNTLFDLEVNVTRGDLEIKIKYSPAHFFDHDITTALNGYARLLEHFANELSGPLDSGPILAAEEREQLLVRFNDTARPYSRHRTLLGLFREQARRAPDREAVACADRRMRYGELDRLTNRWARLLVEAGVRPGDRVGVLFERSVALPAALLAVLKAGASYVPIEPGNPVARKSYILASSEATAVLADGAYELAPIPGLRVKALVVDPESVEGEEREPEVRLPPDGLAYTIYTSGSTGNPKGVMVPHHAAVNLIEWVNREFSVGPEERLLMLSSMGFDLSVYDIFGAFAAGATVILPRSEEIQDPARLDDLMRREKVTFWSSVPSTMGGLVRYLEEVHPNGSNQDLRVVFLSGDWIPLQLPTGIRRLFPQAEVVSLGGATEATVWSNVHRIREIREPWVSIPYGRPIDNTSFYILSDQLAPVPPGAVGDLYIGGVGVAWGYANDPSKTAASFLPDPFAREAGARMYRTGDLGRMLPEWEMEFLGRMDHQIKVRGFRIEMGEIESQLLRYQGVREAVVVPRSDPAGDRFLCAYFVPAGEEVSPAVLREHLGRTLPEYMIPDTFIALDELPLTANGKVDRQALPSPDLQRRAVEYVEPSTGTESTLLQIWKSVLGGEGIGVRHDFFEMGGHSLSAVQVITRVRRVFGVEVPLQSLFEAPTAAGLAVVIDALIADRAGRAAPLEGPAAFRQQRLARGEARTSRLSFAQERLWFIDQLEPGNPAYNIASALRLRGRLDKMALAAAFGEVVRRHEVLRSRFQERSGQPLLVVSPPGSPALPLIDLSRVGGIGRDGEIRSLAAEHVRRPFELNAGPLVRTTLIQLGDHEHILLFAVHHIVADGWSLGILVRELTALYRAFSVGAPSPLPDLPIQYADFAEWQRQWLQGEALEGSLRYWREQLAGVPPLLALPTDRPRPLVASHQGARAGIALPTDLSEQIGELARREGTTAFMTLLAGFAALLSRYTHQDDIAIGAPVAGRSWLETEGLIGFLVNTLVLRADLSGDPSFRELLQRIRQMSLASQAHQDLPFERLVEELRPERSLSHPPLFQIVFAFQNVPAGETFEIPGLSLEPISYDNGTAQFDLTLSLSEARDGFVGSFEYRTELFDRATIEAMARHFQALLASVVADPEAYLSAANLLGEGERMQVVARWINEPVSTAEHGFRLEAWFDAVAAEAPDTIALVLGEERVSYGELRARANGLARELRGLGVGPESLVGLLAERSIELVVGLLGILKAGGAYVPLDPSYPDERLDFMLEDAAVRVVVTLSHLAPRLAGRAIDLVLVDQVEPAAAAVPAACASPQQTAYVIYTSGSTGRPKGVVVTHANATCLFKTSEPLYGFCRADVWTLFHSSAFDFSVWEIWGALLYGGTVVVVPYEVSRSPGAFLDLLLRQQVTVLNQTPSAFQQLLREVRAAARGLGLSLRYVIFGGEALELAGLAPWWERFGDAAPRLVNMYGITETTVHVTYRPLASTDLQTTRASVLGRPLDNLRVYILDRNMGPVPPGIVGEMYVGGAGLARGYLGRPSLTAERFVPDPLTREAGQRLYRTGDLARQWWDGELEYLGRADQQVKIRGFRIELGEIEAALLAHPQVQAAVVLRARVQAGDERLVAYVVAEPGTAPTFAELARLLRQRLPAYMVPAFFELLEGLPLTSNGKVDRGALARRELRLSAAAGTGGSRPRTSIEEALAEIWADLLATGPVSREQDFFELGGHSLLATRLISRLRQVFQVEIPLVEIFQRSRLAALAARIGELMNGGRAATLPALERVPHENGVLLSWPQHRLWFLYRLAPLSPAFNIASALRITGALQVDALEESLGEIVRRHQTLRTRFCEIEGEPRQFIGEAPPARLPLVDLGGLPQAEQQAEVRRLAWEDSHRPFALELEIPFRMMLLRLSSVEHISLLCIHHIATDGWSMGLLLQELAISYEAFAAGSRPELPELPVSYADYSVWQRAALAGDALAAQRAYWRRQLGGELPTLELPMARRRPPVPGFIGGSQPLVLPPDLCAALRELRSQEGVTTFMLLFAALTVVLHAYTNQEDLIVGTNVANRARPEAEALIGLFVNNLALRADLSGDPTFRALLARARDVCLEAYGHQDLPFEKLIEEIQPGLRGSFAPVFQVMLVVQNTPPARYELRDLTFAPIAIGSEKASFDLMISLVETGDRIQGSITYDADVFDLDGICEIAGLFEVVLRKAVGDPDQPLSRFSLLRQNAGSDLISGFNEGF